MNAPPPTQAQQFLHAFRARLGIHSRVIVATTVLAAGLSFLLPNWYRGQSTLLPPSESGEGGFGLLAGAIQSAALSRLGLTSSSTPADVFCEILKSRRLNVAAIEKFGFERIYKQKNMDRTLKEFRRHLAVSVNASGMLQVAFEDRDPKRAADVTNFLVAELDRFNVETYTTRGKRLRVFLEGRVAQVHRQLTEFEERQQAYEREHKVLSASESDAIRGLSEILAQKFSLETQRAYISSFTSPGNSERSGIDRQLAAINQEIGKLPQIKMEGARIGLSVEVQRKLLALLTAQFEDARMQETRDTPTVTVLDEASVPQIKSRPVRSLIVLGAAFASLLGCAAWTALRLIRES